MIYRKANRRGKRTRKAGACSLCKPAGPDRSKNAVRARRDYRRMANSPCAEA